MQPEMGWDSMYIGVKILAIYRLCDHLPTKGNQAAAAAAAAAYIKR